MAVVVGSLTDIARANTALSPHAVEHLKRLVAAWGVIADLCFSDLLLFAPMVGGDDGFVVLAQVRPTTGQTLYYEDQVGRVVDVEERPLVAKTWATGEPQSGELGLLDESYGVIDTVPVRSGGDVIGVLSRESLPSTGRRPSPLERTYMETARDLIRMVSTGAFPFPITADAPELAQGPRVGDGVVRLDATGKITYASPNAVSAFHRLGVVAVEGRTLGELGVDDSAVKTALTMVALVHEELEKGDTVVTLGVIPLVEERMPVGALLLVRDVSELRRKERLLLSKDATIREIHHRVKNNLQTVASLLRLQGRREDSAEVKAALEESVRRIRSIALVHETLSRDSSEVIAFGDIVVPLVSMVEEGLTSEENQIAFFVDGDPGELPADVATPLAVVLTELLQNAVEHAFRGRAHDEAVEARVHVTMRREDGRLCLEVRDNGAGLPAGFAVDTQKGLGLHIVGTLVDTELGGTLELSTDGGTVARLEIPLVPPVI